MGQTLEDCQRQVKCSVCFCGNAERSFYNSLESLELFKMGQVNQIIKKEFSSTNKPASLPFLQCKNILLQTNQLLQQNKAELKLSIRIFPSSFIYQPDSWAQSSAAAQVSNFGTTLGQAPAVIEVKLEMAQIHNIYQLLKHFRKTQLEEPEERSTFRQEPQEEKDCCICFNEKATTMLPCGHCYCPVCASSYIIEQEEHKCPQCRRSFHGTKKALKKTFYEVIEEDQILYDQARSQILENIAIHNINAVRLLQQQKDSSFQQQA